MDFGGGNAFGGDIPGLPPLYESLIMVSVYIWYASKRIQFVKFVRHFLIRKRATLLWFASGFLRQERNEGTAISDGETQLQFKCVGNKTTSRTHQVERVT